MRYIISNLVHGGSHTAAAAEIYNRESLGDYFCVRDRLKVLAANKGTYTHSPGECESPAKDTCITFYDMSFNVNVAVTILAQEQI